jgi:hypothetical protein
MTSAKRSTCTVAALLAASLSANPVFAEEDTSSRLSGDNTAVGATPPTAQVLAPAVSAPADMRRNPFGSKPVAGVSLATRRGGDRVVNDNQLKGVVADNKASNLTTGMNVISEGAFTGSSGMSTVIQNSGNNVLIQNSTIVNVQVK